MLVFLIAYKPCPAVLMLTRSFLPQDLSDINRMLRQGCNGRKRALGMEGELMISSACDSPSKRACPENSASGPDILLKRLQDVVSERQSH